MSKKHHHHEEVHNPKTVRGAIRAQLILALITAFTALAVAAMENYNKPETVPKDVVQGREIVRIDAELRAMRDSRERMFEKIMDRFDRMEASQEWNRRNHAEHHRRQERGHDRERPRSHEVDPLTLLGPGYSAGEAVPHPSPPLASLPSEDTFDEWGEGSLESSATISYEEYEMLEEHFAAEAAPEEEDVGPPLQGWVYLGVWNSETKSWDETNLAEGDYSRPPEVGDHVTLQTETFLRDSKPAKVTLTKGELTGPGVIFAGSELEILEVDHNVGLFTTASWANVNVIYQAQ